uniref:Uncharacterized protein n=1 Tax=Arundo donax TaxID=35708 RepID=A0A0A8XTV5_ARUDO
MQTVVVCVQVET